MDGAHPYFPDVASSPYDDTGTVEDAQRAFEWWHTELEGVNADYARVDARLADLDIQAARDLEARVRAATIDIGAEVEKETQYARDEYNKLIESLAAHFQAASQSVEFWQAQVVLRRERDASLANQEAGATS